MRNATHQQIGPWENRRKPLNWDWLWCLKAPNSWHSVGSTISLVCATWFGQVMITMTKKQGEDIDAVQLIISESWETAVAWNRKLPNKTSWDKILIAINFSLRPPLPFFLAWTKKILQTKWVNPARKVSHFGEHYGHCRLTLCFFWCQSGSNFSVSTSSRRFGTNQGCGDVVLNAKRCEFLGAEVFQTFFIWHLFFFLGGGVNKWSNIDLLSILFKWVWWKKPSTRFLCQHLFGSNPSCSLWVLQYIQMPASLKGCPF